MTETVRRGCFGSGRLATARPFGQRSGNVEKRLCYHPRKCTKEQNAGFMQMYLW
jgi:hypothetical protein